MVDFDRLKDIGLFDARAPRYTSYPSANHFGSAVGPQTTVDWLGAVPSGANVSLYLHIPYCRRLCWFCACRTQGTATNRPLVPYLALLRAELAQVGAILRPDVQISQIHLGGGTPTLLSPEMLLDLGDVLRRFRPQARNMQFSVEIDPTEVDADRIKALARIGMTRASIGVQDFDPMVQAAIGRSQSFAQTRDVVEMLRAVGVSSLNMDLLYGLPHQTSDRIVASVQRVLSLNPDRVALYGYAHVPWMAKRQVMIPTDALPGAEDRLELSETARRLFQRDGYREIGIDHFARPTDALAVAQSEGRLRRNFQGYTDDTSDALIGIGASAISQYPQGYAQNISTSSDYAGAVDGGQLATERGHTFDAEDRLRAAMIESLMCNFRLDLTDLSARFGLSVSALMDRTAGLRQRFADHIRISGAVIRLGEHAHLIARIAAAELDTYRTPEGRHSRAL